MRLRILLDYLVLPRYVNEEHPTQAIAFTLVVIPHIPCSATIGALIREIGARKAATITLFEVGFAILVGGIAFRMLTAF